MHLSWGQGGEPQILPDWIFVVKKGGTEATAKKQYCRGFTPLGKATHFDKWRGEVIRAPLQKNLQRNMGDAYQQQPVLGRVSPLSSELSGICVSTGWTFMSSFFHVQGVASFFTSCPNISQDEATHSGHGCGQRDLLRPDILWSSAQLFRSLKRNILVRMFWWELINARLFL